MADRSVASPDAPDRALPPASVVGQPLQPVPAFFTQLVDRARSLAGNSVRAPRRLDLPPELQGLRYDDYRNIRFRPDHALWKGGPGDFEVQLFHPGFYFQEGVEIAELDGVVPRAVPFSSARYSYDGLRPPSRDEGLAYTGFRLHAPLNSPTYKDEVVVFQGASYLRPLGRGTVYGLSARGLAVDVGEPRPEEFPRFTEFYLVPPAAREAHVWVLALLESPRVTGAYAFRIEPGDLSTIEVTASLFLRGEIGVLGLAPLTSMFLFGEDQPNRWGDFRPEVHDSDGLALWGENGEWIFRPLRNPARTTVCSFRLDHPRGFGLLQRDRAFDSFQDLEARYQDRPSAWVEPVDGFDQGSVRLLEIATQLETDDNVAMAFVPDLARLAPPDAAGVRTHSVRYRLFVGAGVPVAPTVARVVATRIAKTKSGVRFLVDFSGANLADRLSAGGQAAQVEAVVSVTGGRIVEQHIESNPFSAGYRASFEVAAEGPSGGAGKDVELRAFLRAQGDTLSETWSYLWQPTQ